jgi:methionyl-tRNA synthetase
LKFTAAKFDSIVPGPSNHQGGVVSFTNPTTDEEKLDAAFVNDVNELLDSYRSAMDSLKFRNGLIAAMALSARGNQYLQDNTLDNALLANHPERCAQVILNAINLIYTLSVVFHPFMPSTTDGILQQLNAPARSLPGVFSIEILPGHKIGKPDHLFKRIDPAMEVEWRNRFGGESSKNPGPSGVEGSVTGTDGADVKATQGGLSKSALAKQKKAEQKAQSAALAALKEANKTPEVKALEEKMDKQKEVVKDLKTGKTQGDVDAEVAELLKMKTELTDLLKALEASKISA